MCIAHTYPPPLHLLLKCKCHCYKSLNPTPPVFYYLLHAGLPSAIHLPTTTSLPSASIFQGRYRYTGELLSSSPSPPPNLAKVTVSNRPRGACPLFTSPPRSSVSCIHLRWPDNRVSNRLQPNLITIMIPWQKSPLLTSQRGRH